MPMSYEEFADAILNSNEDFTVEYWKGGRKQVLRGTDSKAFASRSDARLHEHKVFTKDGQLVYHRDANGVVRLGAKGQELAQQKTRSLGSLLMWGARGRPENPWGDAVRKGIRGGLGGFGRRR